MKRVILALSCLALMHAEALCATLGEIRTDIRHMIRDVNTSTSKQRFSDAVLNLRIEEAQVDMAAHSRCFHGTAYIDSTGTAREYNLPSDALAIEAAYYVIRGSTANYHKIPYTNLERLDAKDAGQWERKTGDPESYYIRFTTSSLAIGIYPLPVLPYYGPGYLKVEYIVKPSSFTSDASVPFNNTKYLYPYHNAIKYYVSALCFYDKGMQQQGDSYMKIYVDMVKRMYIELKSVIDYNGQVIIEDSYGIRTTK